MIKSLKTILLILIALAGVALPAFASYIPFNTNVNMNVGIGTSTPQGALVVMNGNVGIGTWVPGATLDISNGGGEDVQIENGNVDVSNELGIGAGGDGVFFSGSNGFGIISASTNGNPFVLNIGTDTNQNLLNLSLNNVGIGSTAPGQMLDVQGTVRMKGLTLTGNGAANGNVLVGNSIGVGTWMPASTLLAGGGTNYWLNDTTGNVGINTTYAVGIGTSFVGGTGEAAFAVMKGNVGIGTWVPAYSLDVETSVGSAIFGNTADDGGAGVHGQDTGFGYGVYGESFSGVGVSAQSEGDQTALSAANYGTGPAAVFVQGNVGIGTFTPEGALTVMNGNVGIGTWVPGTMLDVNGTVRTTGFTMSGQTPISGYVLTASDSAGDTTWSSPGTVGGWTVSGNNVYETSGGNVGIGTTLLTTAALTVMNGNVGIGTWVPSAALQIGTGNSSFRFNLGSAQLWLDDGSANVGPNGLMFNQSATANIVNDNGTAASATNYEGGESTTSFASIQSTTASGTSDYIKFLVGNNGATEAMRIQDNSGIANVGIGSTAPGAKLDIQGTMRVLGSGNVGIGSLTPGQALDVNGTVRMTGLTLTGNGAANGNVLVGNSVGVGTWMPASTLLAGGGTNYWLINGGAGNVGINTSYAVGIGTSFVGGTGEAALSVMNGNVGIGTWIPPDIFDVKTSGGLFNVKSNGNVEIPNNLFIDASNISGESTGFVISNASGGTNSYTNITGGQGTSSFTSIQSTSIAGTSDYINFLVGNNGATEAMRIIDSGNVGIGSVTPGQKLDVQGTVRMTGFALTGNGAANGNVLVGNSIGVGTWMPASTLRAGGGTNYWLNGTTGNVGISTTYAVGIGTTFVGGTGEAALSVMNGSVGIGTWVSNGNGQVGLLDIGNATHGDVEIDNIGNITVSNSMNATTVRGNSVANFEIDGFNEGANTSTTLIGSEAATSHLDLQSTGTNGTTDYIRFLVGNNGNKEAMRIQDNSGNWNIGIGSLAPGQALDVTGTVRTTGFTLTGNGAASGNVLVGNSVGVGTWMPASTLLASGGSNYWLNNSGTNVGISTTYAVGIGTTFVGGINEGTLTVMNGNVGIGTWVPSAELTIGNATVNTGTIVQINGQEIVSGIYDYGVLDMNSSVTTTITNDGGFTGAGLQLVGNDFASNGHLDLLSTNYASGNTTDYIKFAVGNSGATEAMRIQDNSGIANVGIGSTAPGAKLDIQGTMRVLGSGNVGIGSLTPGQALDVNGTVRMTGLTLTGNGAASGNVLVTNAVGVGTWMSTTTLPVGVLGAGVANEITYYTAVNTLSGNTGLEFIPSSGNVGISSTAPGQKLDVQGTVRDLGELVNGNVGIGTSFINGAGEAALSVMNGNVGIGTWTPGFTLQVNGTGNYTGELYVNNNGAGMGSGSTGTIQLGDSTIAKTYGSYFVFGSGLSTNYVVGGSATSSFAGSVGIGTTAPVGKLEIEGGNVGIGTWDISGGQLIVSTRNGNVGIGSTAPGQALDVTGTVRTIGFTMSGQTPISGYVLTSQDSAGDVTWSSPGAVGGWTVAGNNVYETSGGNVGIGTTFINGAGEGALTVMNGNVGIGTWVPNAPLDVNGSIVFGNPSFANGQFILQTGVDPYNAGAQALFIAPANSSVVERIFIGSATDPANSLNLTYAAGSLEDVNSIASSFGNSLSFNQSDAVYGVHTFDFFPDISTSTPVVLRNSRVTDSSTSVGIVLKTINALSNASAKVLNIDNATTTLMTVMASGNVGIGTITANGKLIVSGGNVGIGSLAPGQALDVQGTVRDLGELVNGNVGIGTSFVNGAGEGAVSVMNGNVGIGTWLPAYNFDLVNGTARQRDVRRVNTTAGSSSPIAINSDTTDLFTITAMAQASTINITAGTPNNGDLLEIRILDNGTARVLTWGAAGATIASTTTTLPATTVISTTLRVLLEYNSAATRWECIGVT